MGPATVNSEVVTAILGAAAILLSGLAAGAEAQVVERHLPPAPAPSTAAVPAPPTPEASADDRPLGPILRAIELLGPNDAVSAAAPGTAIDVGRLPAPVAALLSRDLAAFLGRPLSRKLISDIEARIVDDYRRRGHPFVEVSAPEQELTGGALRLRVVEFRLGRISVAGVGPREAARVAEAVRARPGETLDSRRLEEDRDWLNRSPFRNVEMALTPGGESGETDLDLKVTRSRPWRLSAGYETSDSLATGGDRYFVSALAALPSLPGAFASYELTASPDFWIERHIFGEPHPRYIGQAGRLVAPTGPRRELEATIDVVETNEMVEAFNVRQSTLEASLEYRFALSNLARLPGDLSLGLEAKRQIHDSFFGGVDVAGGSEDVFQALLRWSGAWNDAGGVSSLDAALHVSPGGADARNTGARFAAETSGRVTRSNYLYATLDFTRTTPLGKGFSLFDEVIGQVASRPLPATEQSAIGGQGSVRGYLLDDGAFDEVLIARQEIRAPPLASRGTGVAATIEGFVFTDLGIGREEARRQTAFASSAGLGVSLRLGTRLRAEVAASWPTADLSRTRAGQPKLDSRLTASF